MKPILSLRHAVPVAALAALSALSCSGGCPGLGPSTGIIDTDKRVENAGSYRLTQPGLEFLQANLGTILGGPFLNGVVSANLEKTVGAGAGLDYTTCPAGPNPGASPPSCVLEADYQNVNLTLTPDAPTTLHLAGTLPVRIQALPMHVKANCIGSFCAIDSDINASLNGDGACPGGNFAALPTNVDVTLAVDQNPADLARYGYTVVRLQTVNFDGSALQNNISVCGGFLGSTLDLVKSVVLQQVAGALVNRIAADFEGRVCIAPDLSAPQPCPPGSTASNGYCRTADTNCVTRLLGIQGTVAGDTLLPLPGARGSLELAVAGGGASSDPGRPGRALGDLNPVAGGATLNLVGGLSPNTGARCATIAQLLAPSAIPVPDELSSNAVAGWPAGVPGPHVALALSERWLNYAVANAYNAGLLCLEVSTAEDAALDSSLLDAFAPSARELGLQGETQALTLQLRLAAPPTVAFGGSTDPATDPTIKLTWPQVSADLYLVSHERYMRVLTVTQDLTIPLQLEPTAGVSGLQPTVAAIAGANEVVTNAPLLEEAPAALAAPAAALVRDWLGARFKSLPAVGLSVLGPPTDQIQTLVPAIVSGQGSPGLRVLQKGSDRFLGVFGYFQLGLSDRSARRSSGAIVSPPPASSGPGTGLAALPAAALVAVAALLLALARRRTAVARAAAVILLVGTVALPGCNCGSTPPATEDTGGSSSGDGAVAAMDGSTIGADAGESADSGEATSDDAGVESGRDAGKPGKDAGPPPEALQPGIAGAYTSAVQAGSELWVAGYAERDPNKGRTWGDLVVGVWDGARVGWKAIDGVPATPAVDPNKFDVKGFRGGQTAPGDDVGLFTSMAVDGAGHPAVAYYDRTNRALKLARYDGAAWAVSTVEQAAGRDLGRYAKLVIEGAHWFVAYQSRTVQGGAVNAAVRLARATETAGQPLSWSFETVAQGTGPCDPALCSAGEVCTADERACTPGLPSGDCGTCDAPKRCVSRDNLAACVSVTTSAGLEGPVALGSGLAMVSTGPNAVGIAYVNGETGELFIATKLGGLWSSTKVDGGAGVRLGPSPALTLNGKDWHLVYRDLGNHSVRHVAVANGVTVGMPETIDAGNAVAGTTGRWVGADPAVAVGPSASLRVSYQDSTSGILRFALGAADPMTGVYGWTVSEVVQADWGGAFSQIVDDAGTLKILNWTRSGGGKNARASVELVAP
ncbi:MAG: hypothetical protein QM765_26680 [Myxococcales bacterium]